MEDVRRAALLATDAAAEADGRAFAQLMRSIASVVASYSGSARDRADLVIELAGTLRVSQHRASALRVDAVRLVTVLTRTLAALEAGRVLRPSVELLLRTVHTAGDEVALRVEELVLARLEVGTVVDQRRVLLQALVRAEAECDPDSAEERERAAADQDNVWVSPDGPSRSVVGANLDVLVVRRWALDFDELVRARVAADRAAGITRTLAQTRADVFATLPSQVLALLAARAAGEGRLVDDGSPELVRLSELAAELGELTVRDPKAVNVFVPLSTLLEVDQRAAVVDGGGALSPFRVRLMAAESDLRRVVCDEHGQPVQWDRVVLPALAGCDLTDPVEAAAAAEHLRDRLRAVLEPVVVTDTAARGHDFTAGQAALITLRDQHCTGIGCGTPASSSNRVELDHELPYDPHDRFAGPTAVWNGATRTDRCHGAKHHGWTTTRDETTGTSTWTSPLGRVYVRPGAWDPP